MLHAPVITIRGALLANGGGGGGGANNMDGTAGKDPSPQTPLSPADYGRGAASGGAGAAGSTDASAGVDGPTTGAGGGGGGGGGGLGYIRASVALALTPASPAVDIRP